VATLEGSKISDEKNLGLRKISSIRVRGQMSVKDEVEVWPCVLTASPVLFSKCKHAILQ
jgi:hypothetical protein